MPDHTGALTALETAVLRLARPGVSDRDIARTLGTTHANCVGRARRRLGIPPQGAQGVIRRPATAKRPPSPLSECWACGKKAARCYRGTSLEEQGWYCKRCPRYGSQAEVYCPDCLDTYGVPPEVPDVSFPETPPQEAERVPKVYRVHNRF